MLRGVKNKTWLIMRRTKRLVGTFGIVLCSALLGCTTHAQPAVEVALPGVEIHAESDFYTPLAPDGDWVVVGSYGRCWRPGHVARDWRPYCSGNWEFTDAGWYWVSDEPWAWATYHYGRWDFSEQYGWYWVPQTEWAPAWVSWHEGGGYIGWVPLQPDGVTIILPQAYVFVEERHFMDPVSSSTVVVNSPNLIRQTANNRGPVTAAIEKASGRKIASVPVQELRHKTEAAVASRQSRTPGAGTERKVETPVRSEAQPGEKKTVAPREPAQDEKPAARTQESATPAPKNRAAQDEPRQSVPTAGESRPEGNHSPAIKEPAQPQAGQRGENQQKPAANEKTGSNPADKDRENQGKQ